MGGQREDRVGRAPRRPEPDHEEVVVVVDELNGVGEACLHLRPTATDPALHLRRELGDEPSQLGFSGHTPHSKVPAERPTDNHDQRNPQGRSGLDLSLSVQTYLANRGPACSAFATYRWTGHGCPVHVNISVST